MRSIKEIAADLSSEAVNKKVLIIGAAFIDIVIKVNNLPKSGEDVKGKYEKTTVGGCAFNVADVLYKLELPFDVFMPVGEGIYADIVKKALQKNNYPVYKAESKDDKNNKLDNGWCLSLVESDGERSFITMEGIENNMSEDWFDIFDIYSYDYFYISGYQMQGRNAKVLLNILKRKKKDAKIIFDPGPRGKFLDKEIIEDLFKLNVIFTLNKTEVMSMMKINTLEIAAKKLYNLSQNPVIITLGEKGAMLVDENGSIQFIDGFKIKVADTIGAGDSHTGGIIAGLICGLSIDESVYFANKTAAYVASHLGAACAPVKAQYFN